MKAPVTVRTEGFDFNLSNQAEIDSNYSALNDAISKNPGLYAVWGVLEARARRVYDDLVTRLEVLEAELFEQYRASIGSPVDAIKACMKKDERRVTASLAVNEAKETLELLTVGKKTIGEQKKDSMLALASNFRAEMGSRISISEKQAQELAARARGSRGTNTPGTTAR
jgi:hypothetical protein